MVLWALELTQFDIKYKARTTIKVQTLVDFIAEFSRTPDPDTLADPDPDLANLEWPKDSKTWILYTDGSSQSRYGAGIILIDPEGLSVVTISDLSSEPLIMK